MIDDLRKELRTYVNPEKVAFFPRFFKTEPGQYGEGDKFLGITVPDQRIVAKKFKDLPLKVVEQLLLSEWHEERLTALLILVMQFKKADGMQQQTIYEFYMAHTARVNNWDLVDSSARDIVGGYLYHHPELLPVLDRLAASPLLWERRIAMLASYYFLTKGEPDVTLRLAELLLHDKEDLMHKAVGWMLREMGKRVDQQLLVTFLDENAAVMPRTMLRYAIEHFSPKTRQHYLQVV